MLAKSEKDKKEMKNGYSRARSLKRTSTAIQMVRAEPASTNIKERSGKEKPQTSG